MNFFKKFFDTSQTLVNSQLQPPIQTLVRPLNPWKIIVFNGLGGVAKTIKSVDFSRVFHIRFFYKLTPNPTPRLTIPTNPYQKSLSSLTHQPQPQTRHSFRKNLYPLPKNSSSIPKLTIHPHLIHTLIPNKSLPQINLLSNLSTTLQISPQNNRVSSI